MEDLIDLIATNAKASQVSDKIKDALYVKSAEKIEAQRPAVAASIFAEPEETQGDE